MMEHFSSSSFVAGLMLGVLISGAWFFSTTGDFPSLAIPSFSLSTSTPSTAEAAPESTAVSVMGQSAGDTVTVASVTVPAPGVWVAVRETNGRTLGNVLGAAKIGGPRTSVSVPLLRATEPGRTYAVELYRDDAKGDFDPARYSVYVDFDTGSRVVAYFSTNP